MTDEMIEVLNELFKKHYGPVIVDLVCPDITCLLDKLKEDLDDV